MFLSQVRRAVALTQRKTTQSNQRFLRHSGIGLALLGVVVGGGELAQAQSPVQSPYDTIRQYDYSSESQVNGASLNQVQLVYAHRGAPATGPTDNIFVRFTGWDPTPNPSTNNGISLGYRLYYGTGSTFTDFGSYTTLPDTESWMTLTSSPINYSNLNGLYLFLGNQGGAFPPSVPGSTRHFRVHYTANPASPILAYTNPTDNQKVNGMASWPTVGDIQLINSAPGLDGTVQAQGTANITNVTVSIRKKDTGLYWNSSTSSWQAAPYETTTSLASGTGVRRWVMFGQMPPATVGDYEIITAAFDSLNRCTENEISVRLRRVISVSYNAGAPTASISESAGYIPVTFTLDQTHTAPLTLTYRAQFIGSVGNVPAEYKASEYNDFTPVLSMATIPAGQTSVTVHIYILEDSLDENTERFLMTYSTSEVDAVLADNQEAVYIQDNDTSPTMEINSPAPATPEGNSGSSNVITFTVTLSAASGRSVTVDYATGNNTGGTWAIAGSDYIAKSGTLTFAPGETTKTVSVNVIGDTVYEPTEVMYMRLSGAVNATVTTSQGSGYIANDDAS